MHARHWTLKCIMVPFQVVIGTRLILFCYVTPTVTDIPTVNREYRSISSSSKASKYVFVVDSLNLFRIQSRTFQNKTNFWGRSSSSTTSSSKPSVESSAVGRNTRAKKHLTLKLNSSSWWYFSFNPISTTFRYEFCERWNRQHETEVVGKIDTKLLIWAFSKSIMKGSGFNPGRSSSSFVKSRLYVSCVLFGRTANNLRTLYLLT